MDDDIKLGVIFGKEVIDNLKKEQISVIINTSAEECDRREDAYRHIKTIELITGHLEGEEDNKEGGTSFDDIRLRAAGISATSNDIVSLQGSFAAEAGFGIGAGLGYSRSN